MQVLLPLPSPRRRERTPELHRVVKEKATACKASGRAGATEGAQRSNATTRTSPARAVSRWIRMNLACARRVLPGPRGYFSPTGHCLRAASCGQSSLALALSVWQEPAQAAEVEAAHTPTQPQAFVLCSVL